MQAGEQGGSKCTKYLSKPQKLFLRLGSVTGEVQVVTYESRNVKRSK